MSTTVSFHGGRHAAVRLIRALIASLTGETRTEAAKAVFIAIGMSVLSDIHADFIVKARGGVGADGVQWPRLSRKTLAYSRRFGPGERADLKRGAGLGKGHRHAPGGNDGLLSAAQLKEWRGIFASRLALYAATMPLSAAKSKAAAVAWIIMKQKGAKTKLEVFGDREHEVLRDTGVLANSLSVGTFSGTTYTRPGVDGGDQQIFDLLENGVIVGTNVIYARSHHEGLNGLPKRPIVPEGELPTQWVSNMLNAGMRTLGMAIEDSLHRGSVA